MPSRKDAKKQNLILRQVVKILGWNFCLKIDDVSKTRSLLLKLSHPWQGAIGSISTEKSYSFYLTCRFLVQLEIFF
ncbi:MAG: hypothetical protein AAFY63_04040, partial [Cyanobacteria bacterium J06643_13]